MSAAGPAASDSAPKQRIVQVARYPFFEVIVKMKFAGCPQLAEWR